MKNVVNPPATKPATPHPHAAEDPDKRAERSAAQEVQGRHKNDGQKDHKGAR